MAFWLACDRFCDPAFTRHQAEARYRLRRGHQDLSVGFLAGTISGRAPLFERFVLGNAEDAQDVAQEAFLRCWRTQERGDEIQNLRAWIFRVALNAAKDVQRSAWNRRVGLLHGTEPLLVGRGVTPVEQAAKQEMLHRLRQALLLLRLEEKEVFLLRQNGDLTYDQIADLHDRPVGTVKTQMRSALQKLRKALVGAP